MSKTIRLALTIGLLSIGLQACQHRPAKLNVAVPDQPVITVDTSTQRKPPTELLTCSRRPNGFRETTDAIAKVQQPERSALERIAEAFRLNAEQLNRIINWEQPGTCPQ